MVLGTSGDTGGVAAVLWGGDMEAQCAKAFCKQPPHGKACPIAIKVQAYLKGDRDMSCPGMYGHGPVQ